jgi:two-component system chemotaxis response regulator CheY
VALDRHRRTLLDSSEKRSVAIRSNTKNKRGVGKTVLVVDDNDSIRRMLAAAFLSDGFGTCVEAENGEEAIALAERVQPDVITLDLSMPVMNGLEAAPKLRKLLPNTPIILFTLYADSVLKTDASRAGINLVLLKTEPLPTLVEKAHELMGD